MYSLGCSKRIIVLSFVLIISVCTGCNINKTPSAINIDNIEENTVNYLIEHGYEVETNNSNKNEFDIQGEKSNKTIRISFVNLRSDYSQCTITMDNIIEDYTQKYDSIDYEELFKLSQILGIERITDDIIKTACEDKRDCYDSSDNDYLLPSGKIMSKIYRVGFFENPIIKYELSANTDYTETITILWNS